MARAIDLSSLTRPEQAVLVGAITLVIDSIIPWWYRVQTAAGSFSYNAGLNGRGTISFVAAVVAMILVLVRASIWPDAAPARDGSIYAVLGAISLGAISLQLVRDRGLWIGPYVGIAAAAAIFAGGIRRRARRRSGWQ